MASEQDVDFSYLFSDDSTDSDANPDDEEWDSSSSERGLDSTSTADKIVNWAAETLRSTEDDSIRPVSYHSYQLQWQKEACR